MNYLFASFLFVVALVGCKNTKEVTTEPELSGKITYGTSFGHCRGYCVKENMFTNTSTIFSQLSRDSVAMPAKVHSEPLASGGCTANNLLRSINMKDWKALPERIGCPDCADGGAEYISIATSEGTKTVTFEYGETPKGLEEILKMLRAERQRMEEKYP